MLLSAGITSRQRVTPEEITELTLTNCLTPASLKSSIVDEFDVRFSWLVTKDADSYNLVVAADAEYTEIVSSRTIDAASVPYTMTFTPGVYYYKVQALAEDRGGSHWAYSEFTLNRPVCDIPTNPSFKVKDDCIVEFKWDISRKSEIYDITIASDAEFADRYYFAKDRHLHRTIMNNNFYSALPRVAERLYGVV